MPRSSGIKAETASDVWGAPPEREPVSTAAYRMLREAILRGQIPQGTRVNELELANIWKISRTPIRDALRRLEGEGLVEAVPRRGMVVRTLRDVDLGELYDLCEALEGLAARRAAERATAPHLGELNALIRAYGVAVKQGEIDRIAVVDDDLHRAIARMAHNQRLEREIDSLRAQLRRVLLRTMRQKGRAARSFREMAKMTAAVRGRSPLRAEAAMREHIAGLQTDTVGVTSESG